MINTCEYMVDNNLIKKINFSNITNEVQRNNANKIISEHYELLLIKEANNYKLSEMKLKNEFDHKETMMDKEIDLMRIRLEIAKIKNMESK